MLCRKQGRRRCWVGDEGRGDRDERVGLGDLDAGCFDDSFIHSWNNANSYQTRLYTKARILGHKRGKRNTRPNQSLVAIEGVDSTEAAKHYLGKVCIRL
jgi:hypothetical protein